MLFLEKMTSSGVGRGRGWLNLNKNQNAAVIPPRPGSSPTSVNPLSPNLALIDDAQFADKSNEFIDLINIVKQLNLNDDGIKFNQKKKHILETWKESCQAGDDVEYVFCNIKVKLLIRMRIVLGAVLI